MKLTYKELLNRAFEGNVEGNEIWFSANRTINISNNYLTIVKSTSTTMQFDSLYTLKQKPLTFSQLLEKRKNTEATTVKVTVKHTKLDNNSEFNTYKVFLSDFLEQLGETYGSVNCIKILNEAEFYIEEEVL